jgi:hypothetical protein
MPPVSGVAPVPLPGVPETKPAEKPKVNISSVPGSVVVLASVDMMKNSFLMLRSPEYQSNILFFQNALETLSLGDNNLIDIRRKQLTNRQFKSGSDKWSFWIVALCMGGVPAAVAIAGGLYYTVRRRKSSFYERRFMQ